MAKGLITHAYLEDTADAIRVLRGESNTYTPDEFGEKIIDAIPTEEVTDDIVSITDAAAYPVEGLEFAIEPVQDLHGYDKPWPAGGGKNLLMPTIYGGNVYNLDVGADLKIESDVMTWGYNSDLTSLQVYSSIGWRGCIFATAPLPAGTYKIPVFNMGNDTVITCYVCDSNLEVKTIVKNYQTSGYQLETLITLEDADQIIAIGMCCKTVGTAAATGLILCNQDTPTSYEPMLNICPISGWTGVNGRRTGVNVWDEEWRNGFYDSSTGAYSANANYVANKNPIIVKPNTTYYFGFPNGKQWVAFWYDANGTFISRTGMYATNPTPLTSPANAALVNFYLNQDYGSTYNHDISINYPATDTEYHAYQGTSIPITFPAAAGTVYGGKVDVVNGKLTVYPEYDSYNGETLTGEWISSMDAYAAGTTPTIGAQVVDLSGVGIEYDITPQQVQMLLGDNNIWCDTGDTSLEYKVDLGRFIAKLQAAQATQQLSLSRQAVSLDAPMDGTTQNEDEGDER